MLLFLEEMAEAALINSTEQVIKLRHNAGLGLYERIRTKLCEIDHNGINSFILHNISDLPRHA